MLQDWGFIFKGDGYERKVFEETEFRTRLAGVKSVEKAVEVAQEWASEGVQLIELCGWFGPEATTQIVAAVGETVAVGYVVTAPGSEHLMKKIFS